MFKSEESAAVAAATNLLKAAAKSAVAGNLDSAGELLQQIDAAALILKRDATAQLARQRAQGKVGAARMRIARRSDLTRAVTRAVFERDNYCCRYCGLTTVDLEPLKLLSAILPSVLPYHPKVGSVIRSTGRTRRASNTCYPWPGEAPTKSRTSSRHATAVRTRSRTSLLSRSDWPIPALARSPRALGLACARCFPGFVTLPQHLVRARGRWPFTQSGG